MATLRAVIANLSRACHLYRAARVPSDGNILDRTVITSSADRALDFCLELGCLRIDTCFCLSQAGRKRAYEVFILARWSATNDVRDDVAHAFG